MYCFQRLTNNFFKKILFVSFFALSFNQTTNFNLNLVHLIPFENASNNYGVSDVWGYTDEQNNEYAI